MKMPADTYMYIFNNKYFALLVIYILRTKIQINKIMKLFLIKGYMVELEVLNCRNFSEFSGPILFQILCLYTTSSFHTNRLLARLSSPFVSTRYGQNMKVKTISDLMSLCLYCLVEYLVQQLCPGHFCGVNEHSHICHLKIRH